MVTINLNQKLFREVAGVEKEAGGTGQAEPQAGSGATEWTRFTAA